MSNSRDDRVGYGKPPRKNQFKPGQSGNPRGRPKGAKDLKTELAEELDEWISITENGKTRKVRKRRVILKALAAKAAKGDVKAADKIIDLHIQMFGFENQRPETQKLSAADESILTQILSDGATAPDVEDANPQELKNGVQDGTQD